MFYNTPPVGGAALQKIPLEVIKMKKDMTTNPPDLGMRILVGMIVSYLNKNVKLPRGYHITTLGYNVDQGYEEIFLDSKKGSCIILTVNMGDIWSKNKFVRIWNKFPIQLRPGFRELFNELGFEIIEHPPSAKHELGSKGCRARTIEAIKGFGRLCWRMVRLITNNFFLIMLFVILIGIAISIALSH